MFLKCALTAKYWMNHWPHLQLYNGDNVFILKHLRGCLNLWVTGPLFYVCKQTMVVHMSVQIPGYQIVQVGSTWYVQLWIEWLDNCTSVICIARWDVGVLYYNMDWALDKQVSFI